MTEGLPILYSAASGDPNATDFLDVNESRVVLCFLDEFKMDFGATLWKLEFVAGDSLLNRPCKSGALAVVLVMSEFRLFLGSIADMIEISDIRDLEVLLANAIISSIASFWGDLLRVFRAGDVDDAGLTKRRGDGAILVGVRRVW